MKNLVQRMWKEEEGVLSFEWILLVTLLTIGIVGGIAAARDAIIDEFGDVAEAMLNLDQSYFIADPLTIAVHGSQSGNAANSSFIDAFAYADCDRQAALAQQQAPSVPDGT
jgi:Flp pilus assembly pilin Flp